MRAPSDHEQESCFAAVVDRACGAASPSERGEGSEAGEGVERHKPPTRRAPSRHFPFAALAPFARFLSTSSSAEARDPRHAKNFEMTLRSAACSRLWTAAFEIPKMFERSSRVTSRGVL